MIIVIVLLGMGVAARRAPSIPQATPTVLDWVVINIALPGLVLAEVPQMTIDFGTLVTAGAAWTTLAVLAMIVLLVARGRGWDDRTTGTALLVVPLGNTSFLGIPAVAALLGADHVPHALTYDQLGTFLGLVTWGTFVAAHYGDGDPVSLRGFTRRVVTFPPLIALIAALVVRLLPPPFPAQDLVGDVSTRAAATLVPLTMLAIGMRLTIPRTRHVLEPAAVGLAARMIVAPALVLAALLLIGSPSPAWHTSVLEASMPPMVTAGVVATAAGLDEELSASLVGSGVIAAMAIAPAWAALIR